MGSWIDRLAENIILTSPDGTKFTAFWRKSNRKSEKTLGVFKFPGYTGAKIQDLLVGATQIEMSIFFDGEDNDIDAASFFAARKEKGEWTIYHPVHGSVSWYLVSMEEVTDPTDSGNVTEIKTVWLDADADDLPQTDIEITLLLKSQAEQVRYAVYYQVGNVADTSLLAKIAAFVSKVKSAVSMAKAAFEFITNLDEIVKAEINSIISAVTSTVASFASGIIGTLTSQLQSVIALPMSIVSDVIGVVSAVDSVIDFVTDFFDDDDEVTVNTACVQEAVAATGLSAIADVIANNDLSSRDEAIYLIDEVTEFWNTIVTQLDDNQTAIAASDEVVNEGLAQTGFVSMSETYNDMVYLVTLIQAALLSRAFDLAASKTITLRKHRAPIEIALTEDVELDDLIDTNGLKGKDILLLSPGTEVTIYG